MDKVSEIFERFRFHGDDQYGGERVTQLAHALQCASLAEEEGASATLITAALLHDVGHLLHDLGESPAARGIDDRHEDRGRFWLSHWFGEAVTEPVRLHVNAKRYLTATDTGYFATLSAGSVRSLQLQGGPFTPELATGFIALPYAPEAVRLRRWDEGAKVLGRVTPDLEHFRPQLQASLA
ncbi:MAG: HD domain-containing protein [Alphaproteobacteria bacterium]|nr:HD domain-containing protein [Alphaproteobacteria bacterium]